MSLDFYSGKVGGCDRRENRRGTNLEGENDFYFKDVEIGMYEKHLSRHNRYPVAYATLRFRGQYRLEIQLANS